MLFTKRAPAALQDPLRGALCRGNKTLVRPFARRDVDCWVAWPRHSDPLFDTYNPPILTPRQRDSYYEQRRTCPDSRQYAVDDRHGRLVGRISLRDMDWRLRSGVLGVSFHPLRLNEGLGTDALRAFLGYYFGPFGMNTLFLDVAAFNRRAHRVYEKCGFRACGQRWGEPQTDMAGIFRRAEYDGIRHLFMWEYGLVRPLLIDMVVRRHEWDRLRSEREE